MSKSYNQKGKEPTLDPLVIKATKEMKGTILLSDSSCANGEVYYHKWGEIYHNFVNVKY